MSYHVTHWTGEMESGFPISGLAHLFDELGKADDEHPDVSVTHESGWSLTVYRSGLVVLENVEEGEPSHLGPLGRSAVLKLMTAVADGRLEEVLSEPWLLGYPNGQRG